jgi:prepilin-type N-terminal cleavage/methylation domain-containing protein
MKTKRERRWVLEAGCRMKQRATPCASRIQNPESSFLTCAFTLIEIMVVVAVMGIILTIGIPSIYQMTRKEGMRKAVSDVWEVCNNARAQAIFRGAPVEVVFHPLERRFAIGSGSTMRSEDSPGFIVERPAPQTGSGQAGQFSEDIYIEMLDINLLEYRESDVARVRFFPNGTSDELTLILRSTRNEWRMISLEVTTGRLSIESDPRRFDK